MAPHGIRDANASYSLDVEGLVFGCFQGRFGNTVHACLPHDIVVHETAHALIDAPGATARTRCSGAVSKHVERIWRQRWLKRSGLRW